MKNNSLVAIDDLSREQILALLERARYFEQHPNSHLLEGRVVATLFFEPPPVHVLVSKQQSTVLEAV